MNAISTHGHKRHTGDRRSDFVPPLTPEEKDRPVVVHPMPSAPPSPLAQQTPVGAHPTLAAMRAKSDGQPAPWDDVEEATIGYDWTCGMMPADEWRAMFWEIICKRQIAEMFIFNGAPWIVEPKPTARDTADVHVKAWQTVFGCLASKWNNPEPTPPVLPQQLQSASEILVDAAIAKAKAAKGTSRLDELKGGIRDGVVNYDERMNESGQVPLFDDIYLWRNGVAIVVRHPDNKNSVVVAVPGRDGKPEICKDITDELATFLMRIRDGQKKLEHPALRHLNAADSYAVAQCNALVSMMGGWAPVKAEAA